MSTRCRFPYCERPATAELSTTRGDKVEKLRRYCDHCTAMVLRVQSPLGTVRTVHIIDRYSVPALPFGQAHCPCCYGSADCTFCDGTGVVGDAARWVKLPPKAS